MHPLASRLAPALVLALTLGACNPRGRECDALRRVLDAAPRADAVAGALSAPRLEDPAMAGAARSLATLLRQSEPALARITMPAADLLAMAMGLRQVHENLEEAEARAEERASALRQACPAR